MGELGHNNPPLDDQLETDHADLIARHEELIAAGRRVPDALDHDSSPRMTQFIKQLTEHEKRIEESRKTAKAPVLAAGKSIDAWFQRWRNPIADLKRACTAKLTAYQKAVADAERLAREKAEAEARRLAEEARRRDEEARREAEAAARERERIERQQREEADAEARAKLETERKAKLRQEVAARERMEAERQRQRNEQLRAEAAAKEAAASDADLSRMRGAKQTSARLKTQWRCAEWDREALDLEALRHYFPAKAIDDAIRSFIAKGGRRLAGAEIVEETTSVVR